ncbi:MAG: hypothetical protein JNM63_09090, partial [Spirochaetia bacterium]|nr:hypothetical protein [Spirochaetia bacterium]
MKALFASAAIFWLLATPIFAKTWLIDSNAFRALRQNGLALDAEGRCILAKNGDAGFISNAVLISAVLDASNEGGLSFFAWVSQEPEGTGLRLAYRGSPRPFST